MKNIKLNASKLQFSKEKITELNAYEQRQVNGGFTYSLSWGARCKESQAVKAKDPGACGFIVASSQRCIDLSLVY